MVSELCGENVPMWLLDYHKDHHLAVELQKQELTPQPLRANKHNLDCFFYKLYNYVSRLLQSIQLEQSSVLAVVKNLLPSSYHNKRLSRVVAVDYIKLVWCCDVQVLVSTPLEGNENAFHNFV